MKVSLLSPPQSSPAAVSCSLQLYIKLKTYAMSSQRVKDRDAAVTLCSADCDSFTVQQPNTYTQALSTHETSCV